MALRAFIAASLLAVAGICQAQTGYSAGDLSASNGEWIYRVSLSAKTATRIGTAGLYSGAQVTGLGGLTIGIDNKLYAAGQVGTSTQAFLLTLNTANGAVASAVTLSGVTASATPGLSLAFSCDGRLWMTQVDNNNLWLVTPSSGQTQLIGNLGAKITGLATLGNTLYGMGGSGNSNLYSIATDTAAATRIGGYAVGSALNSVAGGFDGSGTLWTVNSNFNGTDAPTQANALAQINPSTGAMTTLGGITFPTPTGSPFPTTLQGLAIAAPVCTSSPSDPGGSSNALPGAPGLSRAALGALALLLLVGAGAALRGWRHG
jgi:hypothetical protein